MHETTRNFRLKGEQNDATARFRLVPALQRFKDWQTSLGAPTAYFCRAFS